MLAVTLVIAEKYVSICFLTFRLYSTDGVPKRHGAQGKFPPTLPFDGPRCIDKALKKLTQCVNALKN